MAAYTTIDNPELYFQCKTYGFTTGAQSITFDNTDTSMQPDMVWIKSRSNTGYNHYLVDSVRGVTKALRPNIAGNEDTHSDAVTAFNSNGFTLGGDGTNGEVNDHNQSQNYIAWCWKESATAGFDIVGYTGNGTDDTDISHNLSAVPKVIIVKNRPSDSAWPVYHGANTSAPETDYLVLNTTAATADAADRWSDEAPTSSVFTLGDADEVNTNTETHIAYLFAEKQGFSKFGSYTGNGNADGAFVYTGFKPAYVLIKRKDSTGDWYIFDNKLIPQNIITQYLTANKNEAVKDDIAVYYRDFLSNGFKARGTGNETNADGGTYVYMAFAEAPFVNSNGVPGTAR